MKVCVEQRDRPGKSRGPLDSIAAAVSSLGADVSRWSHAGRPDPENAVPPGEYDAIVVWNGLHPYCRDVVSQARAKMKLVIFAELGWLPQAETVQLDLSGVNAAASWADHPVRCMAGPPLTVGDGELLVLIQDDNDTQMRFACGGIDGSFKLLDHLAENCALPMRVRCHPTNPLRNSARSLVEKHRRMRFDWHERLEDSLKTACAAATINSSAGIIVLQNNVPLLCYGEAVYRQDGAAYAMTGDARQTQNVTMKLKHGMCELDAISIAATLKWVLGHQYKLAELVGPLAALLGL